MSTLDRAGSGGIGDRPAWPPDQQFFFLTSLSGKSAGMVLAPPDGSGGLQLYFDDGLSEEAWYQRPISSALWYPDSESLLGLTTVGEAHGMGASSLLVRYNLDLTTGAVEAGTVIGGADEIIAWETPGERVWILDGEAGAPTVLTLDGS